MSSFPLFSDEGPTRPFFETQPDVSRRKSPAGLALESVVPASKLAARFVPEMTSSGVNEIDGLTGGLPRGCLTEICGTASSGRTSLLLAVLAAATQRQEACALVDVSDAFDPQSAATAGVRFEKLLWIRCGAQEAKEDLSARLKSCSSQCPSSRDKKVFPETPVEQALRVTDLLLQSSGFGLVVIDLGDVPLKIARRIPLTSWFRFQRAVERTPTVLFVVTPAPCAQTCATLVMKLSAFSSQLSAEFERARLSAAPSIDSQRLHGTAEAVPFQSFSARQQNNPANTESTVVTHAQLLNGLYIESELLRSRLERKPARPATATFASKAVRTG